ncbi:MAG: ankyrin repeat domain-containing protein [Terracidiphilus sp.]
MTRILTPLPVRRRFGWRVVRIGFLIATLPLATEAPGVWAQATAQSSAKQTAAVDARNEKGLTPLVVAASAGNADTVRSLLAQGAGVNATSADGRTALIAAVEGNQIETVRILITAGANLNAATRFTGTALNLAENKGETEIAALLLASGARSTGKSVGDTVCVRPWGGDGFCGTVKSFSVPSVQIQVTKIVGCERGCPAKPECSASKPVGGADGLQLGSQVAVPSWCLTQTGVKP